MIERLHGTKGCTRRKCRLSVHLLEAKAFAAQSENAVVAVLRSTGRKKLVHGSAEALHGTGTGQFTIGKAFSLSISRRRLYFARRSDCVIEPTLIWSALQPTAKSASQLSSVSPLRALIVTRQPAPRAS